MYLPRGERVVNGIECSISYSECGEITFVRVECYIAVDLENDHFHEIEIVYTMSWYSD